jgi:glycosyltransferase involved in cell wall biosynthesis
MAFLLNSFADGVLTLAKFQEQWLRRYGVSASRIRTIPNPVDTELFSPDMTRPHMNHPKNPVLINVASLRPIKCQGLLIKAVGLVKEEFPEARLILMGGQSSYSGYENYLKELIADCQVEDNVVNIGRVEHRQVPQLLRSCDMSLISSLSEVCPYAVLESLATGKVTIATAVGGIPDLIRNEFNGLLVESGDTKGFADCIRRVLNDQSLRMSIEENARKSAEAHYSYRVVGEKHREFIQALMNSRGRHSKTMQSPVSGSP